jgi:hypothetical protein
MINPKLNGKKIPFPVRNINLKNDCIVGRASDQFKSNENNMYIDSEIILPGIATLSYNNNAVKNNSLCILFFFKFL